MVLRNKLKIEDTFEKKFSQFLRNRKRHAHLKYRIKYFSFTVLCLHFDETDQILL